MTRPGSLVVLQIILLLLGHFSPKALLGSPLLERGPRVVFDAHVDPVGRLQAWNAGLADIYPSNQVDIAKWKTGGVNIVWVAIWVNPRRYAGREAFEHAKTLIDYIEQDIRRNRDSLSLCRSADECLAACEKGKIAILLGLEGGEPLLGSPAMVDYFARRGIRRITLTWRGDLEWVGSSQEWNQLPVHKPKGITETGIEIIRRMNQHGIVVDLSHVSIRAATEAIEASRKPCIFSHSNAFTLCPHPRNVPDDLLVQLREKGGVIGINFHSEYLVKSRARIWPTKLASASIDDVVRHIDYVRTIAGIDHIGIGSDWEGDIKPAQGLEDASRLPRLWDALRRKGYSEQDIDKIAGLNFLRVLRANEN
ncbi:MAG: dipeptidase [Candidatus Sumerlaeaceae bacterium]|nr:dipeptidase [Candidatus Sumerlaeaceae bacterium]